MVRMAVLWAPRIAPPVGLLRASRIVSGASARVSLMVGMENVRLDWPGVNVSVPVRPV
jgi:hypothetical protein